MSEWRVEGCPACARDESGHAHWRADNIEERVGEPVATWPGWMSDDPPIIVRVEADGAVTDVLEGES